MKSKNQKFAVAKKGIFIALVLSSMALASCEDKSINPQDPPKTFADDDPPKDTVPPKGGGG